MKTSADVKLYESGQVLRWHFQPQMNRRLQTNADHSWGVAVLLYIICDGKLSHNLLLHALLHDTGERLTGDRPAWDKGIDPGFDKAAKAREEAALRQIVGSPLPPISEEERDLLKIADMIEALLTILLYANRPEDVEGWGSAIPALSSLCGKYPAVYQWVDENVNPLLSPLGHFIAPF